jgi:predicted DNA-binding antitoxin AbrB/MazE fold protein
MTQIAEAIYSGGVLKPVEKLDLREAQRVRLIIEPLSDSSEAQRSAALKRLLTGIQSMDFFSTGRLPTREELHDRP